MDCISVLWQIFYSMCYPFFEMCFLNLSFLSFTSCICQSHWENPEKFGETLQIFSLSLTLPLNLPSNEAQMQSLL